MYKNLYEEALVKLNEAEKRSPRRVASVRQIDSRTVEGVVGKVRGFLEKEDRQIEIDSLEEAYAICEVMKQIHRSEKEELAKTFLELGSKVTDLESKYKELQNESGLLGDNELENDEGKLKQPLVNEVAVIRVPQERGPSLASKEQLEVNLKQPMESTIQPNVREVPAGIDRFGQSPSGREWTKKDSNGLRYTFKPPKEVAPKVGNNLKTITDPIKPTRPAKNTPAKPTGGSRVLSRSLGRGD